MSKSKLFNYKRIIERKNNFFYLYTRLSKNGITILHPTRRIFNKHINCIQ